MAVPGQQGRNQSVKGIKKRGRSPGNAKKVIDKIEHLFYYTNRTNVQGKGEERMEEKPAVALDKLL